MPLIPNNADVTYARQAAVMALDWEALTAAHANNATVEGLAVSAGTGLTYSVAAGTVGILGRFTVVAAVSNQAMTAADATNPRIDAVVVTTGGAVAIRAGTAAAVPVAPTYTAGDILLAFIYVPATATGLTAPNIIDKRVPVAPNGTIYTAGAQTAITAIVTNSNAFPGVTIPANYLRAGQHLRVRAWFADTTVATASTLTLRLKLGTTVLGTTGAMTRNATAQTARGVLFQADVVVASTTSVEVQGNADYNTSATASARYVVGASLGTANTAAVTITSNTAQVLTIDVTTTIATDTLNPRLMTVEVY